MLRNSIEEKIEHLTENERLKSLRHKAEYKHPQTAHAKTLSSTLSTGKFLRAVRNADVKLSEFRQHPSLQVGLIITVIIEDAKYELTSTSCGRQHRHRREPSI